MARRLEPDELVEHFTLLPDEAALLRNKSGATRLGFALLLKFFTHMGRFPSGRGELAAEVVEFVAQQVGVVQHTDFCWWCTDGKTYRVQEFPADGPGPLGHGTREVSWLVRLTGATKDPALVPPRERCPVYVGPDQWPRFHGGKKGRLVVALVGALGSECHACGDVTGSFIDHDHFTGYVRGLLCKGCNHIVDMCPHPSGCVYAGYLNDPPASPLRLKYPMDRTLKER